MTCLTVEEAVNAYRVTGRNTAQPLRIRQSGTPSQRPDGIVLDQSPAPGTTLLGRGAIVTLSVSRPPMPDVVCLNADEAQAMIKRAAGDGRNVSFIVESTLSTIERGAVVSQSPVSGEAMPASGEPMAVTLVVSEGSDRSPLRPVVDLQEVSGIGPARAARLQAAGIADACSLARASTLEVADALGVGEALAETLTRNAQSVLTG